MNDPTPGTAKAWTGTGAAVVGGAVAKLILRVVKLRWPEFLDADTIDAIDDLSVAAVVGIAVYFVPHRLAQS